MKGTLFENLQNRSILLSFLFYIGTCSFLSAQTERIQEYYENVYSIDDDQQVSITFLKESMGLIDEVSMFNQIILIRHGEPAINKKGCFSRSEAINFIHGYDSVGIYPPEFIPVLLDSAELDVIHTSTLNRAKHTARLIFGEDIQYDQDSIFREFERRVYTFPNVKLPLKLWLIPSRILWMMGINSRGIESFSEAKFRARRATDKLEQIASKNGKAILVAHGGMNYYIVKYLKKRDWDIIHKGGRHYLAAWFLVKAKE